MMLYSVHVIKKKWTIFLIYAFRGAVVVDIAWYRFHYSVLCEIDLVKHATFFKKNHLKNGPKCSAKITPKLYSFSYLDFNGNTSKQSYIFVL